MLASNSSAHAVTVRYAGRGDRPVVKHTGSAKALNAVLILVLILGLILGFTSVILPFSFFAPMFSARQDNVIVPAFQSDQSDKIINISKPIAHAYSHLYFVVNCFNSGV